METLIVHLLKVNLFTSIEVHTEPVDSCHRDWEGPALQPHPPPPPPPEHKLIFPQEIPLILALIYIDILLKQGFLEFSKSQGREKL